MSRQKIIAAAETGLLKRRRFVVFVAAVLATLIVLFLGTVCHAKPTGESNTSVTSAGSVDGQQVLRDFVDHLASLELSDDQIAQARATIASFADTPIDAVTEGLIAVYPQYAAAVEFSDADDLPEAVRSLTPLTKSDDPFLAADATFFLVRSYMNGRRYEDAIEHLERLTGELGPYTVHRGSALYFTGLAQAGLLDYPSAIKSLMRFLDENPNAAERMRVSAWRQAQSLMKIEEGKMEDIYQRMDYSRRRLAQQHTDPATQKQQDQIVRMLSKLIKEAEKQEASGSPSSKQKPSSKPKPNNQQAKKPPSPKPSDGKSSQGDSGSKQANGTAVVKDFDQSPASPWSRLRDRSRDPANNAVKEKLPARYRDIVERYMEAANEQE